jgi:hypothetical protein
MMIAARSAMLMSGPKLPYDAEVEYLEGVAGGYIVLPWAFKTTDRWELDAQFLSGKSYNGIYAPFAPSGESSAINRIDIAVEGGFRLNYGPANVVRASDTSRHLFVLDPYSNSCKIDSVSYSLPGTHISVPDTHPYLGLLGRLYVTSQGLQGINVNGTGCRVYSCKLYRRLELGMELIPVRFTNEQGVSEGAMYDKVSGQLFRNAGTGVFGFGPDK